VLKLNFRSRKEKALISAYIVALVAGAAATILSTGRISVYNIGKVLGVWMLTALVFQIVLATRMDLIENGIGYDRLTNWHSLNGKIIGLLILLHPFLMFKNQILSTQFSVVWTYISSNPAALLGVAAVAIILGQVVSTLYWKSLDYQIWRKTHMLGYIAVGLGFAHSFLLGTETTMPPENPLAYYWTLLLIVATCSAGYSLFYRRFRKRRKFKVEKVEKEAENVTTVEITPLEKDLEHRPGQFAYVLFNSEKVPREEHHFTVASKPGKKGFEFTIKDVGDFTSKIERLEEGETAKVEGPYGSFTNEDTEGPYTFIAGGIGITPLMSMIRTMDGGDTPETKLIYGNRTLEDIVFREELEELEEENSWLSVEHVLSDEERESFRSGFIDEKVLEEELIEDSEVFLCGPPPMMGAVLEALDNLEINRDRIHLERFNLRS
jgi:predicted ferric reductase